VLREHVRMWVVLCEKHHRAAEPSEAHGASRLQNATPAVSGGAASLHITWERNPGPKGRPLGPTGVNSKSRRVLEDDVSEGSTGYHAEVRGTSFSF
jgi:hypothetical protein